MGPVGPELLFFACPKLGRTLKKSLRLSGRNAGLFLRRRKKKIIIITLGDPGNLDGVLISIHSWQFAFRGFYCPS